MSGTPSPSTASPALTTVSERLISLTKRLPAWNGIKVVSLRCRGSGPKEPATFAFLPCVRTVPGPSPVSATTAPHWTERPSKLSGRSPRCARSSHARPSCLTHPSQVVADLPERGHRRVLLQAGGLHAGRPAGLQPLRRHRAGNSWDPRAVAFPTPQRPRTPTVVARAAALTARTVTVGVRACRRATGTAPRYRRCPARRTPGPPARTGPCR